MSSNNEFIFKIGILGPTRVGKTSLIAAVLQNSKELLSGTQVSMTPFDGKTEKRLSQHYKELEGSIHAGEFHSGAVSGTEESFTYELHLDPCLDGAAGIRFSLLDYPGGWIDASRRPAGREDEWKRCKQWIKDSSVLLIPIESAVMMENSNSTHRQVVPTILNAHDVASVARDWAKARATHPQDPALLIFCPVKCESYFSDNYGRIDRSKELFLRFEKYYHEVLEAAKNETSNLQVLYAPVDTIGCCEITDTKWHTMESEPSFSATYRVRQPKKQAIKGAEAVLVSLCRLMVDARKKAEDIIAQEKTDAAQSAQRDASKSYDEANDATAFAHREEGLLPDLWIWMSGERAKRIRIAEEAKRIADKQQNNADNLQGRAEAQWQVLEDFEETISRLAKADLGPRARKL
jgi:hypothetical protein